MSEQRQTSTGIWGLVIIGVLALYPVSLGPSCWLSSRFGGEDAVTVAYRPLTPFKDLLNFCWETGCRPQEAFRLEARHVEGERCVFPEKESKGKKKKRVIWLTPAAAKIVKRLVKSFPTGRLFRNEDGNPWHRNNVACRFARLKPKLGRKYSLYHLRHSYCQRALKNGVDPITLAELMGHSSAAMIMKTYHHLGQDKGHMAAAARLAAK